VSAVSDVVALTRVLERAGRVLARGFCGTAGGISSLEPGGAGANRPGYDEDSVRAGREKRQRTGAVQKLAPARTGQLVAKRLGLRQSSGAFPHPLLITPLRFPAPALEGGGVGGEGFGAGRQRPRAVSI